MFVTLLANNRLAIKLLFFRVQDLKKHFDSCAGNVSQRTVQVSVY